MRLGKAGQFGTGEYCLELAKKDKDTLQCSAYRMCKILTRCNKVQYDPLHTVSVLWVAISTSLCYQNVQSQVIYMQWHIYDVRHVHLILNQITVQ